jgi:hypothetical protein
MSYKESGDACRFTIRVSVAAVRMQAAMNCVYAFIALNGQSGAAQYIYQIDRSV